MSNAARSGILGIMATDAGFQAEIDLYDRSLNELQPRVRGGDGPVSEEMYGSRAAIWIKSYRENAGRFLSMPRGLLRQLRGRRPLEDLYFSFRSGYQNDALSRFNGLVGSVNLLSSI